MIYDPNGQFLGRGEEPNPSRKQSSGEPYDQAGNEQLETAKSTLLEEYGPQLIEGVTAVATEIRKSARVVIDGEIQHDMSEVQVLDNGEELAIEHSLFNVTDGKIILPNTEFLSGTSQDQTISYESFDYEEYALPFTLVSSLRLDEEGVPRVEHRVKLTAVGLKQIYESFDQEYCIKTTNVPGRGNFSYLNNQIEMYLDTLLQDVIAKEIEDGGSQDLASLSQEELFEKLESLSESEQLAFLRHSTNRREESTCDKNADQHFKDLRDYYRYFVLAGLGLIDETLTFNIEIEIPRKLNVIDSNNPIFQHALTGNVKDLTEPQKVISGLPLDMGFMGNLEWEKISLAISLEDGFIDIKKAKKEI